MYQLDDTIVAVSSPGPEQRVIIRISGPDTRKLLRDTFTPAVSQKAAHITSGTVAVEPGLYIEATLYFFPEPRSYTGEDVAELHFFTNAAVTEALLVRLLGCADARVRPAGPGEFTARAYLNGKMDLTQAEAVNEVIVSSNRLQLAASEKLLAGRLAETTARIREQIMDCLSLLEAGLDFSEEDIEFITRSQAAEKLTQIKSELERLLSGSISYEQVLDLPSVGIAGAPNAGKSSLLNSLLGKERSIVSEHRKTTRDVLTGILTLAHGRCVVFDCAGLCGRTEAATAEIDRLAQEAAVEAIRNSDLVVLCVDISKSDWSEDAALRELVGQVLPGGGMIPAATKSDLLSQDELGGRLERLKQMFGADFFAISAKTGAGLETLRRAIEKKFAAPAPAGIADSHRSPGVAITARHRQAVLEAIENTDQSISEVEAGNDEVAAMLLRAASAALSGLESRHIDEQILERIFSRFCIGK